MKPSKTLKRDGCDVQKFELNFFEFTFFKSGLVSNVMCSVVFHIGRKQPVI